MASRPAAFAALLAALLAGCAVPVPRPTQDPAPAAAVDAPAARPSPPVARQRPHVVRAPHGAGRNDEYYWLRDDDRANPEVLAYLRAENAYADAVLAPLAPLREALYAELTGRIPRDDASVPYRYRGYWYQTRTEGEREYPVHVRRADRPGAAEQVLLDVNDLAAGHAFHDLGNWEPSPDQRLLAYAEDVVGSRQFRIRIKDLGSGELLPDRIEGAAESLLWSDDSQTLYYVENDPETVLGRRVRAHRLGTPVASDRLVYEEADDSYFIGLSRTRSERYLCIDLVSTVATEQRCTEAAHPGEFRVLAGRQRGVEYLADHLGERWVVLTNWDAPDYRLMQFDADMPWGNRHAWRDLVPARPGVAIDGFELFDGFLAISERSEGLARLRLRPWQGAERHVEGEGNAYAMALDINAEPGSDWLRYTYTSLATPQTTYELNVRTGERRELKRERVPGGFDPARYRSERLWATARDGTRVPVTVLVRADFRRDGSAALYQYGYGAYGDPVPLDFDASVLSLVDRGAAYAIAHVRGGQELGRHWYEGGKLANKANTFTDFIDVTDFLVREGYAAPGRVAAMGASAGGLLMGAVSNLAPEKYRVIVAKVPFVDVVTTMLDDSIPLTSNEYDEWGDPADPADYARLLAYSPYDQVGARDYPAMLVTGGLWDSQVQYFEPAKWVARLRARKTDDRPLLLRTHMDAGHGGSSGRFRPYRELAEEYAFVIDQLGLARSPAEFILRP